MRGKGPGAARACPSRLTATAAADLCKGSLGFRQLAKSPPYDTTRSRSGKGEPTRYGGRAPRQGVSTTRATHPRRFQALS